MQKEVATKGKNEVGAYSPAMDLLGSAPELAQEHLRLPKVKIHQATTIGRQGMLGDLFLTPELTKLAALGEKVVFYPITYKLSWYHNKKTPQDQKPVPMGVTEWKSASQFEWKKQTPDGTIEQNFQTATFFVVLDKDLDSAVPTPHQVVLSSTNFTAAALPLMNRYAELKRNKIEPWLCKFTLYTEQSKKGAWFVLKVDPVVDKTGQTKAAEKHFDTLRKWASTMFEMQKHGKLDQTADDLAQDVEDSHQKPVADSDLAF